MDAVLDGSLRTYPTRRLAVVLLLGLCWGFAFPMYLSIYTARPFTAAELHGCTCSEQVANVSAAVADICGVCSAAHGTVACGPHSSLVASSFRIYCDAALHSAMATLVREGRAKVGALMQQSDRPGRLRTLLRVLLHANVLSIAAVVEAVPESSATSGKRQRG